MLSQTKLVLTVIVIFGVLLSAGNVNAATPPKGADGKTLYPYLAQPVSGIVNIRSGSGTAYYPCGKLKLGVNITVVDEEFGWSKIVPPEGSFSWIAKKYIDVDSTNTKVGVVNAEVVRVWVGSPSYDALTSSTTQVKLSKSDFDVVELLGEEDNDYLKIAPPSGAYLYVSANELKYIGPVGAISPVDDKTPKVKPEKTVDPKKTVTIPGTDNGTTTKPNVTPKKTVLRVPGVTKLIVLCREIAEKAEAEKEKPSAQQDYTELSKAVEQIANDPKAGQAKEYAEYLKKLIHRYKFVSTIDAILAGQSAKLDQGFIEIDDKKDGKTEGVKKKDAGKYIIRGVIKPSSIYTAGRRRYKILGEDGLIICYAVPGSYITKDFLARFENKKVALEGTIDNKYGGSRPTVKFTNIQLEETIEE